MIVLWFVTLLGKVLLFVLTICSFGFFGSWALKIADATATVAPLMAKLYTYLGELGAWVPGRSLGVALLAAASILVSGWCIKVGRMILSLFTGGGGNAS